MKNEKSIFLTDAQLRTEIAKCEYCAEKPCQGACPAGASPADFIMAAKKGERSDYKRAAALILAHNPLGGVCGVVCPSEHCMARCCRKDLDAPVNIPAIQAAIVQKAKELGVLPSFAQPGLNGKKVAVVGAGPAGLAAAALLGQKGYGVEVFDSEPRAGGMCNRMPDFRLDKRVVETDIEFIRGLGRISIKTGRKAPAAEKLSAKYDAVVVASGLDGSVKLNVPGEDAALDWDEFLKAPSQHPLKGKRVGVIGGGNSALDAARVAVRQKGVKSVTVFYRRTLTAMPAYKEEIAAAMDEGVKFVTLVSPTRLVKAGGRLASVEFERNEPGAKDAQGRQGFSPVKGSEHLVDLDVLIVAAGGRSTVKGPAAKGVFFAGDMENGPTTAVEAVAAGKNAALQVDSYLNKGAKPSLESKVKSTVVLPGLKRLPVSLEADFFGRKILSPFLLSAAPPTDGYGQMKKAYEAGWAGGVMKTAFDGLPIHIPSEYMFAFTPTTYANCDNVSGHPISRVQREVERLVKEYPDRLTIASTGGPVTGNDEADKKGWQSNTLKLEACGAMAIEYSLSCPQGGDGTKGDIVSQDAELAAKIIGWVLDIGNPDIPKLFKLTAAVTSIYPIATAIQKVFARHRNSKAGVTLANSFPTLGLRKGEKASWEEGIVVGMSGEGVIPISNLTLANVSRLGLTVSGNGGPMDYKAAADFLALGAKTVQFCTVAMKHGVEVVGELHSGLSYLMEDRGIKSVGELIGRALPDPITGFMELTPVKKVSQVDKRLCLHCGNCTRCPYLAISLDEEKLPQTDPARCVGCSICAQKCFAGALSMRKRTRQELEVLKEA